MAPADLAIFKAAHVECPDCNTVMHDADVTSMANAEIAEFNCDGCGAFYDAGDVGADEDDIKVGWFWSRVGDDETHGPFDTKQEAEDDAGDDVVLEDLTGGDDGD